jgi:molybdopterin synthase catalytic subunit
VKVSVRLFAGLHDIVGRREVELELIDGATVADLRSQLGSRYPAVVPFMSTLVCAVNEEYVNNDYRLSPNDQVALIPPVSGGSSGRDERDATHFEVTDEPLDPQRLVDLVRRDESGAVALFYGVVRNHSRGRRVLYLEYDAYPSMALKKMQEVAEEVRCRWEITEIAVSHRMGRMEIGETSLLVAVSAPHRKEAFEVCHYAVDRIKQVVPVWKKEVWQGGESWVEGHPVNADHATPAGGLVDAAAVEAPALEKK